MAGDIESVCDEVYGETARFYASRVSRMGDAAAGYEILYGPPVCQEMVFIGHQPGGPKTDAAPGLDVGIRLAIPAECAYAHAWWRLTWRMRGIWSVPILERCTGLHANFFRAEAAAIWDRLEGGLRKEMENFSLSHAARLVRAMAPRQVVAIGLTNFRRLNAGQETVLLAGKRGPLIVLGSIWDVPALGIVHLSGARITRNDMAATRSYFDRGARSVSGAGAVSRRVDGEDTLRRCLGGVPHRVVRAGAGAAGQGWQRVSPNFDQNVAAGHMRCAGSWDHRQAPGDRCILWPLSLSSAPA